MRANGLQLYSHWKRGRFVYLRVLRRYLEYRGNKVTFVQNFTDIDDKIIKKPTKKVQITFTVSKKYIEEYWKDADGLNVGHATVIRFATENMDEIIHIIAGLLEKKEYAYVAENGDVYFRTKNLRNTVNCPINRWTIYNQVLALV